MSNETPMIADIDAQSGEVFYREMTEQEQADRVMQQERIEEIKAAELAAEIQRNEILSRIGLTADELNIVLGVPVIPDSGIASPEPSFYEDTIFNNESTILPTGPVA